MSSSSSLSLESLIENAKRLSQRLKSREADADRILAEAEKVNNQLDTMRQFKDDLDLLNSIARDKSNAQMVHQINQGNPQLREIHMENMRLRGSLEDHQRALEHIMSKYREHTQLALNNSKLNFQELFRGETEKSMIIQRQEEKIQDMIVVMQKAASMDDSEFEQNLKRDRENISRLIVENQGLRELLQISRKYGSSTASPADATVTDKTATTVATALTNNIDASDGNRISAETQTDSNVVSHEIESNCL